MDNDSFGDAEGPKRPPRDVLGPAASSPGPVRTATVTTGDLLLTVNPLDGSEVEPCPPGAQPPRPTRRTAAGREERARAARPPVPPGPGAPQPPLLDRDETRDRLVRLLSQGRSVRLTGAPGSGRTALLDAVAARCGTLAPDGVVRLNGLHRTAGDLLHDLYATVYDSPGRRPDRNALAGFVRDIGAVVLLDDLDIGGAALDELLDAAPECAFLLAATPQTPEPTADAPLEEVALTGLDRATSLDLLREVVGRELTEEEANWAGDLWFESEGLPLRFLQAGALLRQCDELRGDPEAQEEFAAFDAPQGREVPLPSLGEAAAPAPLLASRLSESARQTLRLAVALGGEVPHQAHLPALVGDTHADAALGELMRCGLLSPAGPRYRLAAGVLAQLRERDYDEDAADCAHTAARHYSWWAGHPSVTSERAVAEVDALTAALGALVPGQDPGHAGTAVLLARSAAPAFAAGLHWSAWERTLRIGSEAARISGEVAEEAYFHHELGVLALCTGNLSRARAELEASIGMRGALADKSGTVAGRRALALVEDRSVGLAPVTEPLALRAGPLSPPRGTPAALPAGPGAAPGTGPTAILPTSPAAPSAAISGGAPRQAPEPPDGGRKPAGRLALLGGARRNLVAAGAGVLLAGVLGTVVTLGAASDGTEVPTDSVRHGQSTDQDPGGTGDGWEPQDAVSETSDAPKAEDASPSASPSPSATPAPVVSVPAAPRPVTTGPSTASTRPGGPSTRTSSPSSPKPPTSESPGSPSASTSSTPGTTPPTPPGTTSATPPEPTDGGGDGGGDASAGGPAPSGSSSASVL
ncbi:ATP-binding protein [Streptomyces sp. C10-9-1]|uniref:ATP-binding protein n=1 Tax=Streptomyces sp. C10-9-1 TaxID=1859285 RepID=UPI003F4A07CC